jgi:hypothetical protein
MRTTAVVFVGLLFCSGCVWTPGFKPQTREGAVCKRDCALANSNCAGSSYSCDKSRSLCIRACIDLERVSK